MGLLSAQDIRDPSERDPDPVVPTPTPVTPTPVVPVNPAVNGGLLNNMTAGSPKGGGGGGAGGLGNSFGDFNFGPVPQFDAPAFQRPDAKSLLSAPGYVARQKAGEDALQRSAASKGLLRSGGTLKDLIEYGQNFATNEYNNDFNQSLQTYGANYQLAKDKFAPKLAQYDMLSKAEIQKLLAQYNRGTIWNNPHGGGGGGGYIPPEQLIGPGGFGL